MTQRNGETETKRIILISVIVFRCFVALCEAVDSVTSVSVASVSMTSAYPRATRMGAVNELSDVR